MAQAKFSEREKVSVFMNVLMNVDFPLYRMQM